MSFKPKNDFDLILKNLSEDPKIFFESAYCSLVRLLTYDYRLPIEHGIDALNDTEYEIFKALETIDKLKLTALPEFAPGDYKVQLFYNSFGRLHIRPLYTPITNYGEEVKTEKIGYLSIPQSVLCSIRKNIRPKIVEETYLRSNIDALLEKTQDLGQLQEIIELVEDAVRHVEDVNIYIDDELFSVVADRHINLIDTHKTQGLFSRLKEKPLKNWSSSQRLALVGLWCLFLSGRSVRFEEYNGKQMTARRLYALLQKFSEYYTNHGAKSDNKIASTSQGGLLEFAKAVGYAAQQSVGQEWLRYRRINGLTFLKTEHLTLTPTSSEVDQAIPGSLANFYECWIGKSFNPKLGYEKIFTELADATIYESMGGKGETTIDSPAKLPIEILIQEIVTAALLATNADYSMSSSLRNPTVLMTENLELLLSVVLALKPKDFYCCIVSRPGLSQLIGADISEQIYRPVQARMEYNRWHFIPGNFLKSDIPPSRHYFYPPAIPDLSEWSDLHHPGHIIASVRFCIRSPGPDMNQPALLIAGHPYRGFYDIRVVRRDGPPFDIKDMIIVRHYCLYMGVIWKRIIKHCEKNPGLLKISGFKKGQGYEPPLPSSLNSSTEQV